jgi:LPXTG-motif cell wall-anchored protein
MSTGAMAGAGVGAVLGVMAVAAGGVFLWRRRTRSRGVEELSGSGVREVKQNALMPPEYGKGVEDTHIIHHEVDGVQWMELEAKETTR